MIKITYVTTGLGVGGAEVMLYNLLAKIDRSKFEPSVVTLMSGGVYREKIESLGIQVLTADMKQAKPTPGSLYRTFKLLKETQPQLLQGWMYHGNIAAQLFSFLTFKSCPVIWTIHHSLNNIKTEKKTTQALIRIGARLSIFASRITYVSSVSQSQHYKLKYSKKNTEVLSNGFDLNIFNKNNSAREIFRQNIEVPKDAYLIGSMARYHPMKDHKNLIKAASIFLKNRDNVYFVLLGTNIDTNNKELIEYIESHNIGDNIKLLGERQDVKDIMPALDILTSSSSFGEAFPMVLGEAMACEIPCVATDIGDTKLIIGDFGKVVEPKNPLSLADKWAEIYSLNSVQKNKLGKDARKHIADNFSLEKIVHRYENIYISAMTK